MRKFQPRHATDAGRRKAGKFYFDCPTHGRFGFDGNAAMQEHVLEHITWSDESARAAAGADMKYSASSPSVVPASSPPSASRSPPSSSAAAKPVTRPPAAKPAGTSSGKQTATQTPPAKKPWLSEEDLF